MRNASHVTGCRDHPRWRHLPPATRASVSGEYSERRLLSLSVIALARLDAYYPRESSVSGCERVPAISFDLGMSRQSNFVTSNGERGHATANGQAHNGLALLRFGQLKRRFLSTLWMFCKITLTDMNPLLSDANTNLTSLARRLDMLLVKRLVLI